MEWHRIQSMPNCSIHLDGANRFECTTPMRPSPDHLRDRAEALLAHSQEKNTSTASPDALVHELQVHQIELTMQNEALKEAQIAAEVSREEYAALYNLAPTGYLTLSGAGLITRFNAAGAALLGVAQEALGNPQFERFVVNGDRYRWRRAFANAMANEDAQVLDIALLRADGSTRDVCANCKRVGAGHHQLSLYVALTDIGDRVRSETLLKKSQAQLQLFIAHAPVRIAMFDRYMNCLAASNRWAEDYSRGHASIVGLNHYELHPDLPDVWKAVHQSGLAGETIHKDEDRWVHADGSEHWLQWSVQPWNDGLGNIGGIVIASEDITERIRAANALRKSEALKADILNSVAANIAVIDSDGVIVAVNEPWRNFSLTNSDKPDKPPPNAGIGTNYLAVLDAAASNGDTESVAVRDGILAVLNGTVPSFGMEYSCHSPETQRWFYMSVTPLGQFGSGAVIAHSDISERKAHEQALQEANERLALAQLAAQAGVWNWDLVTGEIIWSDELYRLFGLERTCVIASQEALLNVIHPEDRAPVQRSISLRLTKRTAFTNEYRIIRPGGEVRWVQSYGDITGPVDQSPTRMCGIVIDITSRKEAETALEVTRAEMQDVVSWQVARHTVAAIAHELHQPLGSLMALAGAASLLSAAGKSKASDLRDVTQRMVVEAERAAESVRNLMGSLRKPLVTCADVSIGDLLQEIVRSQNRVREGQAEICLSCPPDLPLVRINAQQVEKAIQNLINNSQEAMLAAETLGGRIWINADVEPDKSAVCVTVLDNGPGVELEMPSDMFHPFASVKANGLGVGLTISQSLIQAQGGRLWHEAHDSSGAKFHFTLPIAR
jgi:PAS domain S-box-containing protein